MVSGLSGGIAAHLGISSSYVRAAFISLAFAGLVGVFLYGLGWLLAVDSVETDPSDRSASAAERIGLALMFFAVLVVLRGLGLWFGAASWAVVAASFGSAVLWDQSGRDAPERNGEGFQRWKRPAGAILVIVGLVFVVNSVSSLSQLGPAVLGATAAAVGVMLIFGPRIAELGAQLSDERRERIASEERSKIAADLHDSVLQSLAMIQRTDDAPTMVTIARAQERELRGWLYGKQADVGDRTLAQALQDAAQRVEHHHNIPVNVVVVNDIAVDQSVDPLLKAASEAMLNAARHSGASQVSVYAEIANGKVDAFVSDSGTGFSIDTVPDDRHGVRQSIIGRMERHGGTAEITTEHGEGTEVHLSIPLENGGSQ